MAKIPGFHIIVTKDAGTKQWMMEIGRAIVFFGVLERLMLDWAAQLRGDKRLLVKYHNADIKRIAPLLRRGVLRWKHALPRQIVVEALESIKRAEGLSGSRNDVAHSRVEFGLTNTGGQVPIGLLIARRPRQGRRVFALRRLEWLTDFVQQTKQTTKDVQNAMEAVANARVSKDRT
ncbi:MAG: hypothetical protein ACRETT_15005 [Steroidobacteraceae bacterium]